MSELTRHYRLLVGLVDSWSVNSVATDFRGETQSRQCIGNATRCGYIRRVQFSIRRRRSRAMMPRGPR